MEQALDVVVANSAITVALACVAVVVTHVVRRPALAYAAWLVVLVRLIMPPLIGVPVPNPFSDIARPLEVAERGPLTSAVRTVADAVVLTSAPISASRFVATLDTPANMARPSIDSPSQSDVRLALPKLLVALSLAGSALWFLLAVVRLVRFDRCLRTAAPAPEPLKRAYRTLASRMGLRNYPELVVVHGRIPPLLWTAGKARIVLPADLFAKLDARQQEAVIAHELAHYHRRDHWVRWFEATVIGLYWWHPVVWWAHRRLQDAEEACCDASVLSLLPERAKEYASALLATMEHLSDSRATTPLVASGFGRNALITRRFQMILNRQSFVRTSWRTRMTVSLIALLVLCLSPLSLPGQSDAPSTSNDVAEAAGMVVDGPDLDQVCADLPAFDKAVDEVRTRALEYARAKRRLAETPNNPTRKVQADARAASLGLAKAKAQLIGTLIELNQMDRSDKRPFRLSDENLQKIEERQRLLETLRNRFAAAQDELTALEEAREKGEASMASLLDAQRRLCEAEWDYRKAFYDSIDVNDLGEAANRYKEQAKAASRLKIVSAGRDAALALWRQAKTDYEANAASAKEEAQARQQYFLFRSAVDQALTEYQDESAKTQNFRPVEE
jgi:beta-lactamase regulating signal transducer with metallopeptidase domain